MNTWEHLLTFVREDIDTQQFETWFQPTQFVRYENGALYVRAASTFARDWLDNHTEIVLTAAARAGLTDLRVIFITERPPSQTTFDFDTGALNSKYTFESFVVGPSNQFAHAATLAVAERPARAYNPLFLYGGVGLGKTHLMHAVGHRIRQENRSLRLTYVTSEKFMNELIRSIRHESVSAFRDEYRNTDVLLIDDIQFIADKERTAEEFFHTFNTLYDSQRQIVISADCPPRQIPMIEERLRSRFEWGLIADVQPPDLETKAAILKKKADSAKIALPDNVALYLASNIRSNVRELEGALVRLVAMSSVYKSDITQAMAEQALRDILGSSYRALTMEFIQKKVADRFGLRIQDLKQKSNARAVAEPRQICMYLCKHMIDASLPQIGKEFGKHHTTVLHSISKIEKLRRTNKDLDRLIQELITSIG